MDFELYGDDSKGIIKLDPRTKLVLFLTASIISLNSFNDVAIAGYNIGLCLLLGLCGRRSFALKAGAAFLVAFYLRYSILLQGTGSSIFVVICQALISIFLFTFPILITLVLLIKTTRISQFLAAFQAMHLPAAAVIPVAVMFRFIPTVQDEWAGIRKAMAFRGIEMDMVSVVRHPFHAIEYMLVPLLISSVSVMEELSAAALARGLDADHVRTSYEVVKLHALDYLVMIIFGGFAVFAFASGFMGVGI